MTVGFLEMHYALTIFLTILLKHAIVAMLPTYQDFRARHRAPAMMAEWSFAIFLIAPAIFIIITFALSGMFPTQSQALGGWLQQHRQ